MKKEIEKEHIETSVTYTEQRKEKETGIGRASQREAGRTSISTIQAAEERQDSSNKQTQR